MIQGDRPARGEVSDLVRSGGLPEEKLVEDALYVLKISARREVEKALGWTVEIVQHLPKMAPSEVMRAWAKEGVAIDWEKLLPPKGFRVLPKRWVVERTFSWLGAEPQDE